MIIIYCMKIKKEESTKKFLILSLITFIPLFIFNQQEPISEETHYYLKEWINEDGLKEACLLEGDLYHLNQFLKDF